MITRTSFLHILQVLFNLFYIFVCSRRTGIHCNICAQLGRILVSAELLISVSSSIMSRPHSQQTELQCNKAHINISSLGSNSGEHLPKRL